MKLPNPYTQRKLAEARELPPRNGPFAEINVGFHEIYTRLVEQVLAQLGDSVPVVVLIGDDATLLCDGGEQREQVIPARYHELKALAHLAFGVQLTLMANGSGRLTELTASELHEKRAQIREAQAAINASPAFASSSPTMKGPAELLCRARTLVDRVLAEGVVDFERLHEHVRALASHALDTAQLAVCIELEQLHALLSRWRNDLGETRWAGLYVVICGAHQPRYREAACQYFGSTCSRDTSLTSGPRISYSATGGVFRRTFLPTLPAQKCGNSSRRCVAAPVALSGARNETLSVAETCLSYPNCSPRGING
jgi:hypothetical protein